MAPPIKLKAQRAIRQPKASGFTVPGWALPALLVFTAIIYSKAVFCDFTALDDDIYILTNGDIRDFSFHGLKTIFTSFYIGHYQPLSMLFYLLEYKFFEFNPLPYHLLNVLFHLANVALVFKLTERLSRQNITAIVVAILFALHPMHVESVAWISELKDVSYSFFYLLSLLVYLRYMSSGYRPVYYTAVLLFFIASILCKSAAVTLPVLLIVVDLYMGRKLTARSILEKVPLVALSLAFGVLAIISQRSSGSLNEFIYSYGAVNDFFLFTSALAFYIVWMFAPLGLSVFHYYPNMHNGFLPGIYYVSLPLLLVIAGLAAWRNAYRKEVWFGFAFFLVTISVMLKIVSVGSGIVAERYTYISYIGLFYIIGQMVAKNIEANQFKNLTICVFSFFVVIFSVVTWNRMDVWKDYLSLLNDLVEKNPNYSFPYWRRGNVEKKQGNSREALEDYTKAIELNPGFGDAYYNRGVTNNSLGNLQEAIADYSEAIKLDPKYADSYNNRGLVYYQLGDKNAAIKDYRKALALNHDFAEAFYNLGWAYDQAGDKKTAIEYFHKAIALKPDYAEAYNNLGWVYDESGNIDSALQNYVKANALKPGFKNPLYNIAALKVHTGDFYGAVEKYNTLIALYPDENKAYMLRAEVFMRLNDMRGACADWQKARSLGNEYADGLLKQYCR